jgi:hypothetical protein
MFQMQNDLRTPFMYPEEPALLLPFNPPAFRLSGRGVF